MEQGKGAESKHDGDHGLQQTTNIHFNPDKKIYVKLGSMKNVEADYVQ